MDETPPVYRRTWRFYRTESGRCPIDEFLNGLSREAAAAVQAEMKVIATLGHGAARHLQGDIWEVRISHDTNAYRILFAPEGHFSHVLLALEGFTKTTRKTPRATIKLAEDRLADWRRRGAARRARQ